jgi:hypothetical protein
MGKTKHEKTYVDFEHPYEQNIIGLRGVIYFGLGLFLLVVITFGLMWFLQDVMEQQAVANDERNRNPMLMSDRDRLPPEPRLQSAPGVGVGIDGDRINLELRHPQAEWEVLQQQYREMWEKGTSATLPIEEAKQRFLAEAGKASPAGAQSGNVLEESKMIISDASSGRVKTIRRR